MTQNGLWSCAISHCVCPGTVIPQATGLGRCSLGLGWTGKSLPKAWLEFIRPSPPTSAPRILIFANLGLPKANPELKANPGVWTPPHVGYVKAVRVVYSSSPCDVPTLTKDSTGHLPPTSNSSPLSWGTPKTLALVVQKHREVSLLNTKMRICQIQNLLILVKVPTLDPPAASRSVPPTGSAWRPRKRSRAQAKVLGVVLSVSLEESTWNESSKATAPKSQPVPPCNGSSSHEKAKRRLLTFSAWRN